MIHRSPPSLPHYHPPMALAALDPAAPVMQLLDLYGPSSAPGSPGDSGSLSAPPRPPPPSPEEALAYVRGLAHNHYENFSVLSSLVPADLRDDFAAVYAFCRWADDLADETGKDDAARARSVQLLSWWRDQTRACFAGQADHPVFIALRGSVARHDLPVGPFLDLIDAFEQDQRVTRYQTWEQLIDYCARSANPVGRIVLHLGGCPDRPENAQRLAMSDSICTALQLTNFWQDVRRDLLERDRVYLPEQETGLSADTLRLWLDRPDDPAARVPYIRALRKLVNRTWPLFQHGRPLPLALDARLRPVVWLFAAGGAAVLESVERIGCTTLWTRPRLSKFSKAALVARAWLSARLSGSTSMRTRPTKADPSSGAAA